MPRVVFSIYDDPGNPHYGGGGAVVVQRIARHLSDTHDVTVLAGSYRGSRAHLDGRVRYRYLPVGWAGARGGQLLFSMLAPLASLFLRHDVWVESFTPPFSVSLLPVLSRRPVIGLVQMLSAEDMEARYHLPFGIVERRGLRWYRNLVVLNEADRETVTRHSPKSRVWVVHNGVDVPPPELVASGCGEHILFLGRIDVRQKGLDLLVEAHARAGTGLPLVIAGSGAPAELVALRRLVDGRPDVRLVGQVAGQAKQDLLRHCAFLVMPSRFETFGLCALEAMSYGKAVVYFDLPRLRWIAEDCGVRVPPFDVHALAGAMHRLATDDAARQQAGPPARATAEQCAWARVADRYRAIIAEVVRGA
ncbi:MAG TPA: glycosyltransferase family 4 protein [Microlunatus sp.]|nr:glycosyltransferase family 4 protein [Microlunatus sp.]